jgi:L-rhamnose mutarotase
MNKYKARKNESSDNKRDAEGPNTLHENVSSSRQSERNDQRSAQPRQREPEYKPKHGKKWPAVLLAGIAAAGVYDAGMHHQEVKRFFHVVETSISEGMQQAQQPPYKKVVASQPAAVHYSQAPVAQHPAVVKEYVIHYVTRYVATPVQAQSPQMTAQEMEYKLQNRQLSLQARAQSMQYRLQQEQLRAQEQAQAQQLAVQQQQQAMQYQIQQRYAAIQQMQGTAYAVQNYANAYNMFIGRY